MPRGCTALRQSNRNTPALPRPNTMSCSPNRTPAWRDGRYQCGTTHVSAGRQRTIAASVRAGGDTRRPRTAPRTNRSELHSRRCTCVDHSSSRSPVELECTAGCCTGPGSYVAAYPMLILVAACHTFQPSQQRLPRVGLRQLQLKVLEAPDAPSTEIGHLVKTAR
eukprot:3917709-Rhodomonas_salina.8